MKKKLIIFIMLASVLLLTRVAVADQVETVGGSRGYGPYQAGLGGEFTFLPVTGSYLSSLVSAYSSKVSNIVQSGTFESFCLETNEYLYPNTPYNAAVNFKAINGGTGTSQGGDPISLGTAWLYSQFATGTLPGYEYGSGRLSSAADLQNAIWYLEDESLGVDNAFAEAAKAHFTALGEDAKTDANGAFNVSVLNLTTLSGDRAQDQLIYKAVPEPATLLLLGFGLVGLLGLRKKITD